MTVQQFKAQGSGRLVALNLSNDYCEFLEEDISFPEMHDAIAQFENKRIEEYWNETILPQSPNGKYMDGFEVYVNTASTGPKYYKTSFLQNVFKTRKRGKPLMNLAQSLSLKKQRSIASEHRPKSRIELQNTLLLPLPVIAPDFHSMLDEAASPYAFLQNIVQAILDNNLPPCHPVRYFELLTITWAKGWLLFPQSLENWPIPAKWTTLTNPAFGGDRSHLIRSVYIPPTEKQRSTDTAYGVTCRFFATSDIKTIKDLSPEIIRAYEDICIKKVETRYPPEIHQASFSAQRGRVRTVAIWLLDSFNLENPHEAVLLKRPDRKGVADNERRIDGRFNWLRTKRSDLVIWADTFQLFIASMLDVRVRSHIDRLNILGDFICTLENPPLEPWLIERRVHIFDASLINSNTFLQYLRVEYPNARRRTDILSTIRKYYNWLRDYLVASGREHLSKFPVPVLESDSGGRRDTPSRTSRDALPPYVMSEMKSVLTEDDFAFPKAYPTCTVKVRDQITMSVTNVFDPGLTVCLYTLFDTPIRSHQARWLDSGCLDDLIYNPIRKSLEPNPSEFSIPKRREGALRLEQDSLRAESWITLWVNTNKTANYDSPVIGYAIPYVSPELEELIKTQILWQKRYLPELREPLDYDLYQRDVRERERPKNIKRPKIAPLFRDARSPAQNKPIDYTRLARFYTRVLEETQTRIEQKYGQVLKLVTYNDKNKLKWAVDLHSLRVSGITNLIEAGVPLEVVQQFVAGHQVLVMTLHYLKYSPAKLRQFIELAHDRMLNDVDFVGSEVFSQSLNELAPFLLGQDGAGTGAGYETLKLQDGILTITSDGICPGTSCSSGGALEVRSTNKYGPVPGGKRCGLCRYWLTGPAHLLGQVAAVNNLAFEIRKKGQEVAHLNDLRLEAEDSGNQRKARELRDRVDLLNREVELDINEWAARYRYAEKSIALMDNYLSAKQKIIATDASLPVPIITASSPIELKITLEQAHEFTLLDQITQMSTFTTGFKNREAELEKNNVLSKMMISNGMTPFLLSLNAEQAHEAGNLLSAMLLQQVNTQELDEILYGKKPLSNYPSLTSAIKLLEENATPEALVESTAISRLARLVGKTWQSSDNDPDEDLFG